MLVYLLPAHVASCLVVVCMAIFNRAAGSDIYGLNPPGKPALYAAGATGLLIWLLTVPPGAPPWLPTLLVPYTMAIAWPLAYLEWRVWAHGRWIDLEDDPTDPHREGIERTTFERLVDSLSFGHDGLALFWRHLTAWPGLVLVWLVGGPSWLLYIGPPFAAALALSHYLARAINRWNFHFIAELSHGALWGALIIAVAP